MVSFQNTVTATFTSCSYGIFEGHLRCVYAVCSGQSYMTHKMRRKTVIVTCFIVVAMIQVTFLPIKLIFTNRNKLTLPTKVSLVNEIQPVITNITSEQRLTGNRTFYVFSVIAINSSGHSWNRYVINGWESENADAYTYLCCYLYENGAISSSMQIEKRRYIYATSPVYARQVVCGLDNKFRKTYPVGVALIAYHETCDVTVEFHAPVYTIKDKAKSQFAVHGKVAYGNKNPAHLIEWLEYQRYFGVDKVVIYPYHLNKAAIAVLKYYSKDGFLEMIPFSTVPKLSDYPRMFGVPQRIMIHDEQVINYDAQERLRAFKYFTIIDTDEFILPLNNSITTFASLMELLLSKEIHASSFAMYDQLHLTNWGKTQEDSELLITQYGNHTEDVSNTPKNLHVTDRIKPGSASIHGVNGHKGYHWKQASAADVVLKHYRACRGVWLKPAAEYNMSNRCFSGFKRIRDVYMENIAAKILPRVLEIRHILNISQEP